jgi:hypothetical protein
MDGVAAQTARVQSLPAADLGRERRGARRRRSDHPKHFSRRSIGVTLVSPLPGISDAPPPTFEPHFFVISRRRVKISSRTGSEGTDFSEANVAGP